MSIDKRLEMRFRAEFSRRSALTAGGVRSVRPVRPARAEEAR